MTSVPGYSDAFFAENDRAAERSAAVVVPLVLGILRPDRILDVGCSTGVWLAAFAEHGVRDVTGMDGDYVDRRALRIPASRFIAADLSRPLHVHGEYDMALCLEVAEHLPPESGPGLVSLLTTVAPVVLFSAAVPGQRGTHHVNPRWPRYWRGLFAARGFAAFDPIRPLVWHDERVDLHYRQNIFLFARADRVDSLRRGASLPIPDVNCLMLVDEDVVDLQLGLRESVKRMPEQAGAALRRLFHRGAA